MSDEVKPKLSWDAASDSAPTRPEYTRSLTDEAPVARPRRVVIAFLFSLVTFVCAAVLTVLAVTRFSAIRDNLVAALPADAISGYEPEDIERAAQILIVVVLALAGAFAIFLVLCTQHIMAHRGRGARVLLIVFGVLYLFLGVLDIAVRDGKTLELVLFGLAAAGVIGAIVLMWSPNVTRWLAHDDTPRTIALRTTPNATP